MKHLEDDDPMEPIAMQLPCPPGFDATGVMARCLVEEYAMMGFDRERLLAMFKNPFYQALYSVTQRRGDPYVQAVLDGVFGPAQGDCHAQS